MADFPHEVRRTAELLAAETGLPDRLRAKRRARQQDESIRPLERLRHEQLTRMRRDFAGGRYRRTRREFVYKTPVERFAHPAAVGPLIQSRVAEAS